MQKFQPKAILIPVEGRKLSAAALEESLGSHWSLTSPPQHPRRPLIFDAQFHAVFRGEAFYLKDTSEENSLVHPLGWTHRGSEANPRTHESPQSKPARGLLFEGGDVYQSQLFEGGDVYHTVFLRNKHLIEYKYYWSHIDQRHPERKKDIEKEESEGRSEREDEKETKRKLDKHQTWSESMRDSVCQREKR